MYVGGESMGYKTELNEFQAHCTCRNKHEKSDEKHFIYIQLLTNLNK